VTGSPAAYRALLESGELSRRVEEARRLLRRCRVCPRHCDVDRLQGERGTCEVGARALVSSHGPHMGEESPLRGTRGSGTIFFSSCNLRCVFCQNYEISQLREGRETDAREIARMMLSLQAQGCHNINWVTPSHQVPQILEGLLLAAEGGLDLPIVYNTSSYDALDTLRLLDGIVDIYMPDFKYASEEAASRYSHAPGYPEVARRAVREMHRQVGDLALDERGVATRGVLVRHLVLPEDLSGTAEVMRFLATEISPDTFVNIMDQYYPCHTAGEYPELSRRITVEEFDRAIRLAREEGIHRLHRDSAASVIRWLADL
jgi:putative pyruvate formate lyase activating enzyme